MLKITIFRLHAPCERKMMELLFAGENLLLTKYITSSDYVLIDFGLSLFAISAVI